MWGKLYFWKIHAGVLFVLVYFVYYCIVYCMQFKCIHLSLYFTLLGSPCSDKDVLCIECWFMWLFFCLLQLCVILEPMQELMSRHKTYSLSPRDCLKTCLFQKWQRMVAPPGKGPDERSAFFVVLIFAYYSFPHDCNTNAIVPAAEPARQAPNKRRKRKMSGGSTVSTGGGNSNNSNSKKKSPASSFALSSQVPVSISFWFRLCKHLGN